MGFFRIFELLKTKDMCKVNEIWKDIPNYVGFYQASNKGNIRSVERVVNGKWGNDAVRKSVVLKPAKSKVGYLRCLLMKNSKRKNYSVHRLVALTFIDNNTPHNQINHLDGNKLNNCFCNLEWCSSTENNRHARLIGLNVSKSGQYHHSYGLKNKQSHVLINTETQEIKPICEVAKEYGYTARHITMMVKEERTNKTKYKLNI